MTPDARAIFLHKNVLYNNIALVTGGHKKHGGGGGRNRIDPKNYKAVQKTLRGRNRIDPKNYKAVLQL